MKQKKATYTAPKLGMIRLGTTDFLTKSGVDDGEFDMSNLHQQSGMDLPIDIFD